MKTRSAKNKGVKLQNFIRDVLRKMFVGTLEDGDIESRQMGGIGTDIVLSPAAKRIIKFDFEAKNQEKINIWECLRQTEANTEKDRISALVFSRNREDVYVVLKFSDFINMAYPEQSTKVIIEGKKVVE